MQHVLNHVSGPSFHLTGKRQKGKANLDFTEARDSEWQWHQLGRMQVCTLLQTDNHASTHHSVFTGRMPFLPPNQQRQSTEGKKLNTLLFNIPYSARSSSIFLYFSCLHINFQP